MDAVILIHNGKGMPMKSLSIVRMVGLIALLLWGVQEMKAQQGRFGFGLVAGEPTGLAWRYRIDNVHSVAGSVGFLPGENVRFSADFLWQTPFRGNSDFYAYYGPGVFVGYGERRVYYFSDGSYRVLDDAGAVGVRLALGVAYNIPRSPVDLFFEVAPAVILTAPAGGVVDVGLGVRVYP